MLGIIENRVKSRQAKISDSFVNTPFQSKTSLTFRKAVQDHLVALHTVRSILTDGAIKEFFSAEYWYVSPQIPRRRLFTRSNKISRY
jgi:hypothetical protein